MGLKGLKLPIFGGGLALLACPFALGLAAWAASSSEPVRSARWADEVAAALKDGKAPARSGEGPGSAAGSSDRGGGGQAGGAGHNGGNGRGEGRGSSADKDNGRDNGKEGRGNGSGKD